jgi:hypothetical protein
MKIRPRCQQGAPSSIEHRVAQRAAGHLPICSHANSNIAKSVLSWNRLHNCRLSAMKEMDFSRYSAAPYPMPRNSERYRSAWPGALSAYSCSVTQDCQTRPSRVVFLVFLNPSLCGLDMVRPSYLASHVRTERCGESVMRSFRLPVL